MSFFTSFLIIFIVCSVLINRMKMRLISYHLSFFFTSFIKKSEVRTMVRKILWKLFKYPKVKERDLMWESYIDSIEKRIVRGRISQ